MNAVPQDRIFLWVYLGRLEARVVAVARGPRDYRVELRLQARGLAVWCGPTITGLDRAYADAQAIREFLSRHHHVLNPSAAVGSARADRPTHGVAPGGE